MLISRETTAPNSIRAWEAGRVRIGENWFNGHLIVSADQIVREWSPTNPSRPSISDLAPALALEPEIVVIGIAAESPVPDIELMIELGGRSIGLEQMTLSAACRTFNVLVQENRRVVAVLCHPPGET